MFLAGLKNARVCGVVSMVEAQGRRVEALSREIAMAIKALSEGRQPETIKP